ncbi:MAG: OmpH family outer membrane protein [Bryobacteraceae bacterium]
MNLLKHSRLSLLTALTCAFVALPAAAQSKVAVLNVQQSLLDTAEIKKAQADLEAKYKPRQDEMNKLQTELEDIQRQLQTMGEKLTQQAQQDLSVQGQRKQRELRRLGEDLQSEIEFERTNILTKAGKQMTAVVQKIAEERGFDVVIDVSNTVFFKPALDITKDATAAYDKAYPLK